MEDGQSSAATKRKNCTFVFFPRRLGDSFESKLLFLI